VALPGWVHSDPDADDGYWRTARRGSRSQCARGEHCADPRFEEGERFPAWTRAVFCDKDMGRIRWALKAIPELWVELWLELGKKPARGFDPQAVAVSRVHPPIPLRPDIDALMRDAVWLLTGWAERVRAESPAGLTPADTEEGRRMRPAVALAQAARLLGEHLPAMVGLPEDMVAWTASLNRVRGELAADIDAGTITGVVKPGGWAYLVSAASGAGAGLAILDLHHRMRRTLGLTAVVHRLLAPCASCSNTNIRQAQGDEYAECHTCGRLYNRDDYDQLAKDYRQAIQPV
jgi:hypothetical protein